jgi:hypothetical protein
MIKSLLTMIKVLWIAARNPLKQDFVNELYKRKQAQMLMYRYGIGKGAKHLPPGKSFR